MQQRVKLRGRFAFLFVATLFLCFHVGEVSALPRSTVSTGNQLKIAFIRAGDLWASVDGAEVKLTRSASVTTPKWSFDGKWLAYIRTNVTLNNQTADVLQVRNLAENEEYDVHRELKEKPTTPADIRFEWSPNADVIAFQSHKILSIRDLRSGALGSLLNISLGVDRFAWFPDGTGFLVSASAHLMPDGWTRPVLYKIPIPAARRLTDADRFFTIPGQVKLGHASVLAIGTGGFKWAPDSRWIAFIVHPTASWSADSNVLCVLSSDGKQFIALDEMLNDDNWFQWAPDGSRLAYIGGRGRVRTENKRLRFVDAPKFQIHDAGMNGYADGSFIWHDHHRLTVSRGKERGWQTGQAEPYLPRLFQVDIDARTNRATSAPITTPPSGFGDVEPRVAAAGRLLLWLRKGPKQHADLWIAQPDGTDARVWVRDIDIGGNVIYRPDPESFAVCFH